MANNKSKIKEIDVTKTGPQSYRDLQKANEAAYKSAASESIFSNMKAPESYIQPSDVVYEGEEYSPLYRQSKGEDTYGGSIWDNPSVNEEEYQNLADIRAENQPWYAQIGNGLAKGVVLAGTTFLDGTVGLILGAAKGVGNWFDDDPNTGFLSGLWDNDFSKAMQSVNEWSEKAMPNYYTKEEQEQPWYENIFTANFLGDKFIKNLGFSVGALYSGGIGAGILKGGISALQATAKGAKAIRGASKLAETIGIVKTASEFPALVTSSVGATISAVNEGRIEALNNSKDWFELHKTQLDDEFAFRKQNLKNQYGDTAMFDMMAQKEQEAYNAALGKLTEDRIKMGNADLLMNIPILTASNIIQFGKMYANGFKTGRRAANIIGNAGNYGVGSTKLGATMAITKGALSEGTEEITQKMASTISGKYYEDDVNNFYKAKTNRKASQETLSWVKSFAEGINETVNDTSSWEEFTIGTLTGVLGVPRFRGIKNAEGKFQFPIGIEGGAVNEWREYQSKIAREQEITDYLNNRVNSPEFKNYYQGLVRHNKYQDDMNKAVEDNDEFEFKNAEHAQLVSDIAMFDNAGKLDDLITLIDETTDYSDEELESIVRNTSREVTADEQKESINSEIDNLQQRLAEKQQVVTDAESYLNRLRKQKTPSIKGPKPRGERGQSIAEERGENASRNQSISYYENLIEKGKEDINQLTSRISSLQNQADSISKSKMVGPFIDENGNPKYSTPEGKQEMIDKLKQNREEISKTIQSYIKIKEGIDTNTGQQLTDAQLEELTWMKSQLINWSERAATMSGEVKSAIGNVIADLDSLLKFNEEVRDFEGQQVKRDKDGNVDASLSERYLKADENTRKIKKAINTLNAVRMLEDKTLAATLAVNPEFVDNLIKQINEVDDSVLNTDDKNNVITKLNDIVKLGKASETYSAKLKEYLGNPQKQAEDHINADRQAEEEEKQAESNTLRTSLDSASNLREFRDIVSNQDNTETTDKVLKEMEDEGNEMAKNYRETTQYNREVSRVINESDADPQIKEDALKLLQDQFNNSENLNELANPNSIYINNENAFDDVSENVDESVSRFQEAQYEIQKAMSKINNDNKFKDRFSKEYKKPVKNRSNTITNTVTSKSGKTVEGTYTKTKDKDGFIHGKFSGPKIAKFRITPTSTGLTLDELIGTKDEYQSEDSYNEVIADINDGGLTIDSFVVRPDGSVSIRTDNQITIEGKAAKEIYNQLFNPTIKGDDRADTGDSGTSTVPSVGEQKPVVNKENVAEDDREKIDLPKEDIVGDETADTISQENKKNINEVEAPATPKEGETRQYYKPTIPELHIEASKEGDFRPFPVVVYEREGKDYSTLYDWLLDNNAFSYLNNGNLKIGDEIGFMIDPAFEEKVKDNPAFTEPTIFMFTRTKDGTMQIVGSLDSNSNVVKRFEGLSELRERILKEYKDSKNQKDKFIATPTTKVSKIMVGKVPYGNNERSLKDIIDATPSAKNKKPLLGIVKNGTLVTNGKDIDVMGFANISSAMEGRVYLLIPNGAGKYTPIATRVKHFNREEFNLEDAVISNTPIGKAIKTGIEELANSSSQEDVFIALKKLNPVLYLRDIDFHWFTGKTGSGLVISRLQRDTNGDYVTYTDEEGNVRIKRDKIQDIYFTNNKKFATVANGFIRIDSRAIPEGESSILSEPRDTKDVIDEITGILMGFNLPIQVATGRINGEGYNERLINSNVLTSNITEATTKGTWFTTDYFDENGKLNTAVSPASVTPDTTRRINTPVGGINSVVKGTEVKYTDKTSGTNSYYIDLGTNTIRDNNNKDVTSSLSEEVKEILFDLAWAKNTFGDTANSAMMIDNKVVVPSGKVLDRTTQQYLDGKKAQEIKDIIAGKQKPQEEKVETPKTVQSDIPVFDSSLEIKNPIENLATEYEISDDAKVGYFELNGKIHKGYLIPLTTVDGIDIYLTKEPTVAKSLDEEGATIEVEAENFYAVFPNGKTVPAMTKNRVEGGFSVQRIIDDFGKALKAKPQKVKDLSAEKTLLTKPVVTPPNTTGGAANTGHKEDSLNTNKKASRTRHKLREAKVPKYEKWDKKAELEWLDKVLPQLSREDRIATTKGLIPVAERGTSAWGQFDGSIVTLSDIAAKGTAYHEAFHVVFNLMLDESERVSLLKEYRAKHPSMDDLDLEEELAEDFREFVMQGGKDTRSLGRKIIDFFKSLFAKIKYWNQFRPSSIYYFRAINEGKYAERDLPVSTLSEARNIQEEYSEEMQDILDKAPRDSEGNLLAPNSNKSNLTERQYAQVRTKAFKDWFGDWENNPENASKVVDENGEPLVVYHGTTTPDITTFDLAKTQSGKAFWFANEDAQKGVFYSGQNDENLIMMPLFVNMRKPLLNDTDSMESYATDEAHDGGLILGKLDDLKDSFSKEDYQELLNKGLNDNSYLATGNVTNPNQLKSATDNIGTFSRTNNDIRYREVTDKEQILRQETQIFLDNFDISIKDLNNYDSDVPLFDALNRVINVKDADDITEGVGYAVAFMMQYNPRVNELINLHIQGSETFKLKAIRRSIRNRGTFNLNLSSRERKAINRKEAIKYIGADIAVELRKLYNLETPKDVSNSYIRNIWNTIKEFFKKLTPGYRTTLSVIANNTSQIANAIKLNDPSIIRASINKPGTNTAPERVDIEKALIENPYEDNIIRILQNYNIALAGSASIAIEGTLYRPSENPLHDIDFNAVDYNREQLDAIIDKEFSHNTHIRTIKDGEDKTTETYLILDRDFSIEKVEGLGLYKLIDKNTKEVLGNYVGSELTLKEGVQGKFLDFFMGKDNRPFNNKKVFLNNREYLISDYRNAFQAKIDWARLKDIWDYNRFISSGKVKTLEVLRKESERNLKNKLQNTRVIWGHPAIGKTTYLERNDDILEWDDLVNEKRNNFLRNQIDPNHIMDIKSKEYKQLRSKYMMNWKEHPEYVKFLTDEWNNLIARAKKEGKRVFASPLPLLEIGRNDIDLIVALGDRAFTERDIQRGNTLYSSRGWKQNIDKELLKQDPNKIVYTEDYFSDFMRKNLGVTWGTLNKTEEEMLLAQGWTKETFNMVSQEERDNAMECVAF